MKPDMLMLGINSAWLKSQAKISFNLAQATLIVPKKRTALLVNRLMLALNEAMRDQDKSLDDLSFEDHKRYRGSTDDFRSMDLQRRGHGSVGQQKGRRFWKCYFNAVTCF
ncbi:unnamed protein product [Acanthoscelides obtectus]|uniref:Uncharacterized protein n=1 Tax=Acanthoscelides obtectus TaxID=200917 RepID=A0A9P0KGN4_ACAOB|nr:unnamed protein product [Acanthoscelides obtectus]CAK1647171.1 hypothetical protein AOBTE_LOCUS15086 [Acanthoscelides obtectus]